MRATCSQFERSIGQGHGDEDMAAAYWASRPVAGSTTV
jgi:hypothetical protein